MSSSALSGSSTSLIRSWACYNMPWDRLSARSSSCRAHPEAARVPARRGRLNGHYGSLAPGAVPRRRAKNAPGFPFSADIRAGISRHIALRFPHTLSSVFSLFPDDLLFADLCRMPRNTPGNTVHKQPANGERIVTCRIVHTYVSVNKCGCCDAAATIPSSKLPLSDSSPLLSMNEQQS